MATITMITISEKIRRHNGRETIPAGQRRELANRQHSGVKDTCNVSHSVSAFPLIKQQHGKPMKKEKQARVCVKRANQTKESEADREQAAKTGGFAVRRHSRKGVNKSDRKTGKKESNGARGTRHGRTKE